MACNAAHWIAGQAGVIPLAVAEPGVAKTELHRALARAANRRFLVLMLDQSMPEDMGGYPVVRSIEHDGQEHTVMAHIHDERFVRATLEPSVLLVDELTNTGHSVQAAALQLMAEGIPGCWIFAAANPPEKAAAGVELAPPMVNRLCVLEWEIPRDAVLSGFRNGFVFPEPEIPLLPDDWQVCCPRWGALLASFIDRFPELLQAFPADLSKASEPYPTCRSWTNAGRLLAAAESVGADEEVRAKLVYGCVGQAAGTQFFAWLSQQDLPDPEDLLRTPSMVSLPRRGDLAIAIVGSVVGAVRRKASPDRWEAARDVLEHAYRQQPEVAIAAEGGLWQIKPAGYLPRSRNGVSREMSQTRLGGAQARMGG